jgi:hypothetical protein
VSEGLVNEINPAHGVEILGVHQFETTPKAFANFSPGLERSDNPG